jgi:uncharacterized protein
VVSLATTIDGYDAAFVDRVVPLVDLVEITPDRWAKWQPSSPAAIPDVGLAFLTNVAERVPLVLHGVGLSIGSHDRCSETYVRWLDQLFSSFPIRWHSEHLAYSEVDGEPLGTMVELPRTEAVADLVAGRIRRLQDRYRVPFLLENVAFMLPEEGPQEYSRAGFLNAIVDRTGCGLLLDVYNLECDRHNFGFDIDAFLGEVDLGAVREIHIANGTRHKGFRLDIHSRLTADSTVDLARRAAARCPNLEAIVFELLYEAVDVLGHDAIAAELVRLREGLSLARAC